MGVLGILASLVLPFGMFGQPGTSHLISEVEQKVLFTPGYGVFDWIAFSLNGSEVTLYGLASRPSVRETCERRVRAVDGITSVLNEIELLPSSSLDIGVRNLVHDKLFTHPRLRKYDPRDAFRTTTGRTLASEYGLQQTVKYPIHILVENGVVTLEGHVQSVQEREIAGEQAQRTVGVREVRNHLLAPIRALQRVEKPPARRVVRVSNRYGNIRVRIGSADSVSVRARGPGGNTLNDSVDIATESSNTQIRVRPNQMTPIHLEVDLPNWIYFEASTDFGSIAATGLVQHGELHTVSGSIELTSTWEAMDLDIVLDQRPGQLVLPTGTKVSEKSVEGRWQLQIRRNKRRVPYGRFRVRGQHAKRLVVRNIVVPADSRVKLHWQARELLRAALPRPNHKSGRRQPTRPQSIRPEPSVSAGVGPVFVSDVRLVNLTVAVRDRSGDPVTDLDAADFMLVEEGVPQEIKFFGSLEAPFNLVVLLDGSQSTENDRAAMNEAVEGFIKIASPRDRVALYALANSHFHVLSRLTADRAGLLDVLDLIYSLSGGSPVYDAIALSYIEELVMLPNERNALIVITDGLDNQLMDRIGTPSTIAFEELRRRANEMATLIYPVFIDPLPMLTQNTASQVVARRWKSAAMVNLEQLAQVSGGRVFYARSIRDMEPILEDMIEELKGVYSLGYYPQNQVLGGEWRRFQVEVDRRGATVHSRAGYRAN